MSTYPRINASRAVDGMSRRVRFSSALPWVFILGVATGTMLPIRQWTSSVPISVPSASAPSQTPALPDHSAVWARSGDTLVRHPVDVIRTIDGDTFEAQVHLWPGLDMTTRVRLRGIDAPELKASCPQELRMAQGAGDALRGLLGEGGVTIYNIGPDKYNGRVVADASTARTPNVSAALLAGGFARSYSGGRRSGWCTGANG